jgi:hypothetical protein
MKNTHLLAAILAASFSLTGSLAVAALAQAAEKAIAPEINPPGDIPDSQVFVKFASPQGFTIKVPEGWARSDDAGKTVFNDKYNKVILASDALSQPLDLAYAKSALAPDIEKTGRAVKIVKIVKAKLKSGEAVRVIYESNSEPNSVTNKQVRQENERYYFAKDGKLVSLDLSAPKGADNVDQWQLISSSFRWK